VIEDGPVVGGDGLVGGVQRQRDPLGVGLGDAGGAPDAGGDEVAVVGAEQVHDLGVDLAGVGGGDDAGHDRGQAQSGVVAGADLLDGGLEPADAGGLFEGGGCDGDGGVGGEQRGDGEVVQGPGAVDDRVVDGLGLVQGLQESAFPAEPLVSTHSDT